MQLAAGEKWRKVAWPYVTMQLAAGEKWRKVWRKMVYCSRKKLNHWLHALAPLRLLSDQPTFAYIQPQAALATRRLPGHPAGYPECHNPDQHMRHTLPHLLMASALGLSPSAHQGCRALF